MIINNYTGDRLNFGLAVEMARNVHNYKSVKLLVVDDDCSIDNPSLSTGRRGLAGINLITKIAGAMSAKGSSLHDIHNFCANLLSSRSIRTIGFSFHHNNSNDLVDIEIGYGIHGEPGSFKLEREKNFKPILDILTEKLRLNDVKSEAVILFNNLGGTSEFVFYHFVHEFIELMKGLPLRIVKVYSGKFLTSLSKEALSVTVMEVKDPMILELLKVPVNVPSGHLFNNPVELGEPSLRDFEIPKIDRHQSMKAQVTAEDVMMTRVVIERTCKAAIDMKEYLNEIDGELGDSDTGSTLARGAEALMNELSSGKLDIENPHELLLQTSSVLMTSMGGTSGAIFSIFFQCASKAFASFNLSSMENWIKGMSFGMAGIKQHGKANIGDRTLLDALNSGYEAMRENSEKEFLAVLKAFVNGCEKGCEATKSMKPKSGRSSYSLSDKGSNFEFNSKNPDPGAYAVKVIAQEVLKAFEECAT